MSIQLETNKHSVKHQDVVDLKNGSGVLMLSPWSMYGSPDLMPPLLPDLLPSDWRQRDFVLRQTVAAEGMWGNAVATGINQITALEYRLTGGARLVARAESILNNPRFLPKLRKWARDWFTQNNGYHGEVIRATNARGSRVVGIDHLDALRCQRTGNPEEPIIYVDRGGREHVLKWYQWFGDVDMESASLEANGMGQCAAERAYQYIRELAVVTAYIIQKTGGKKPLAIYLVNNLHPKTLQAIVETAEQDATLMDQAADGLNEDGTPVMPMRVGTYMGAIIGALPTDKEMKVVQIDLAGLPDRFNSDEEWKKCLLVFAKSIGIDVQELQPLTGQALGTGAQSRVLHEKGKHGGVQAFKQSFRESLKVAEVTSGVAYYWSDYDILEQIRKAELAKIHTEDVVELVGATVITPQQGLQVKVDYGELSDTFLQGPDATPEVTTSSADGDLEPASASGDESEESPDPDE